MIQHSALLAMPLITELLWLTSKDPLKQVQNSAREMMNDDTLPAGPKCPGWTFPVHTEKVIFYYTYWYSAC
jgi:hypothetical protein